MVRFGNGSPGDPSKPCDVIGRRSFMPPGGSDEPAFPEASPPSEPGANLSLACRSNAKRSLPGPPCRLR